MVDSIVVGKFVGKNALAAVGACGSMNFLFFSLSMGLASGIGVIASQYFGADDLKGVRKTIANSYYVLASVAIIFSVFGWAIIPALLRLLNTPDTIIADSIIYGRITIIGILGISLYNGIASVLRALGDSKTPLCFLIFTSILNVVLDLVFVIYFAMGVEGVALATIVSQYASAVLAYVYAKIRIPYFNSPLEYRKPDKYIIGHSFHLGLPLAFQSSLIAISCMVLQGFVNGFGPDVVAAFTITGRIEQLVHQPYQSLGTALMTFSGQNMGAGKPDRVKKGFWQTSGLVLIISLLLLPVMYFLGQPIARIFVEDQVVIDLTTTALKITSVFYFALGMIYTPRAISNGCGDAGFAIINGLTEVFSRVFFSWIFVSMGLFGHWSVWITTGLTWLVTAIICCIRYASGKWKTGFIMPE